MTAINIARQPLHRCLHVVTDGATYNRAGIVSGMGTKVFTAPNWPGVIAIRGIACALPVLGQALSWKFQSFDELVGGVEQVYASIIESVGFEDSNIELILAGWSYERDRPESYVIYPNEELGIGMTVEKLEERKRTGEWVPMPEPYKLIELPAAMAGPYLSEPIQVSAGWCGIDVSAPPERCIATLHHLIECQRHDVLNGVEERFVGGFAQLTTVTPDGISQRILSRWPDKIDETIKPSPPDWVAWRAEHWKCFGFGADKPDPLQALSSISPPPVDLSRLRRERLIKKQRKLAKRNQLEASS